MVKSVREDQAWEKSLKVPPTARLVLEAVVLKTVVEVALVEVALREVKFWRVVEACVWRAPVSSILNNSVPIELVKERNLPAKEAVEEALINMPVVPVAFT